MPMNPRDPVDPEPLGDAMGTVQYRSMMSSTDAIIWNIEQDPQLRSTVMSVWVLDSVPTAERMAANIDRMVAAIPRLRQRVEAGRPRPHWVEVDDLDLDRHYSVDRLPDGSGLDEALAYAQRWVREPFDRHRPLWRLGLLTGLEGGRAAIVIKVHHAIADGMGMVLMLGAFTDLEADPPPVPRADDVVDLPVPRETFSRVGRAGKRVAHGVASLVRRPIGTAGRARRTLVSTAKLVWPHRTPHSRLMTERSGVLTMDARVVPVTMMKGARRAHEASLNDVFVAVVADAIDRYHLHHDVDCPRLRVHVPVNSRTARTADVAGNEWVPARVTLHLDDDRGTVRVGRVRDQLTNLRAEPALHHINTVSAAIQKLGRPISRWIIGGMMKGVDVLASNVPGPPFPLYLAGARVEQFYAFGPPAGAAMNITLFSYDGNVWLGITTDAAAVIDRERFLACLDDSIAELVGLDADAAVLVS
jgi:WS/DGAT/MGAT family acyltransferase